MKQSKSNQNKLMFPIPQDRCSHCSPRPLKFVSITRRLPSQRVEMFRRWVTQHLDVVCAALYSSLPDFPLWRCKIGSCGVLNLSASTCCHRCGSTRGAPAWVCLECSSRNPLSVRVCTKCASPMVIPKEWTCPSCSHGNPFDTVSCQECQHSMMWSASNEANEKDIDAKVDDAEGRSIQAAADDEEPLPGPPGFDWMCRAETCGTVNSGDEEHCTECQMKLIPSAWCCEQCGAKNHRTRSQCFDCGHSIGLSWTCTACEKKTSVYQTTCRGCGENRPPIQPTQPISRSAGGDSRQPPGHRRGASDWICPMCSTLNFSWRDRCFQCDGAAGDAVGGDAGPRLDAPIGDSNWVCRSCMASNFRTREDCWQCGAKASSRAPSMQKQETLPSISHEGFQASAVDDDAPGAKKSWAAPLSPKDVGDWVCPKCFSKNFKSRKECFKCGAAKATLVKARMRARTPVKL